MKGEGREQGNAWVQEKRREERQKIKATKKMMPY